MVVAAAADSAPVDVVMCVEDTAQGGAYINDIK